MSEPIDFTNPASIEAELTAAAAAPAASAKAPKAPAKPRTIKVSWIADHDIATGDLVEFDYELPKAQSRGQLSGIAIEDMTDDQLKIEYRNANSVYYKTVKAGAMPPRRRPVSTPSRLSWTSAALRPLAAAPLSWMPSPLLTPSRPARSTSPIFRPCSTLRPPSKQYTRTGSTHYPCTWEAPVGSHSGMWLVGSTPTVPSNPVYSFLYWVTACGGQSSMAG